MISFKKIAGTFLLCLVGGIVVAQNNTNSPYTRYGYGDLAGENIGVSSAMGGIAYGLRSSSHINPLNPASYTAIDSLTFMFEGGLSLQNTNMVAGSQKINVKNSSLDYIAMQFRIQKWLAMSIGILPYSNVGYNVSSQETSQSAVGDLYYTRQMSGDGGLHQFYGGLGFRIYKSLSVGANVSFLYGNIERNLTMIYPSFSSGIGGSVNTPSYSEINKLKVKDMKLDFGLQFHETFGKNDKHGLVVGFVYTPKRTLNHESTKQTLTSVAVDKNITTEFGTPNMYGVGVSYSFDKRLIVGADYSYQQWGDIKYDGKNCLSDRSKIAIGAEYIPSKFGRNYLGIIRYRIGGHFTNQYYKAENGQRASREFGLSGGFGLPVPRTRSIVNLAVQYVRVNGLQPGMLDENTVRLSIGLVFDERWFFKRKVE